MCGISRIVTNGDPAEPHCANYITGTLPISFSHTRDYNISITNKEIMQTAINLTDTPRTEYNGWSDWTTWNCALWIGGDEGLYNEARHSTTYGEFVETMHEYGLTKTPDGAVWAEADFTEMQECLEDL